MQNLCHPEAAHTWLGSLACRACACADAAGRSGRLVDRVRSGRGRLHRGQHVCVALPGVRALRRRRDRRHLRGPVKQLLYGCCTNLMRVCFAGFRMLAAYETNDETA